MHRFFFSAVFVASFAAASPTEAGGPLVWYSYEASGTATTLTDVAGVGNGGLGYHATATNSTFQPDRPPGADFISSVPANAGSLAVDGTSGSGGISNDTNILTNAAIIGAGGFTMETWFRRRALNNASNSFQKLLQTEIENFHIPSFSDEVRFSDGETPTVLLGTALVDEWHHVAAVFTYRAANPDVGDLTGTINFYYDGAPVPTAPNVLLKLRDIVDNPIHLGSSNVASESFAGDLFETRISLGALSRADLLLPAAVADAGQDIIVKGEGGNALVNLDGSAFYRIRPSI